MPLICKWRRQGQTVVAAAHRGIMLIFSHQLSAIFSHCVKLIEMHGREEENRDEADCFAFFFFQRRTNVMWHFSVEGREAFSSRWPPIIWTRLTTHHKSPVRLIYLFFFHHAHNHILFCSFLNGNQAYGYCSQVLKTDSHDFKGIPLSSAE